MHTRTTQSRYGGMGAAFSCQLRHGGSILRRRYPVASWASTCFHPQWLQIAARTGVGPSHTHTPLALMDRTRSPPLNLGWRSSKLTAFFIMLCPRSRPLDVVHYQGTCTEYSVSKLVATASRTREPWNRTSPPHDGHVHGRQSHCQWTSVRPLPVASKLWRRDQDRDRSGVSTQLSRQGIHPAHTVPSCGFLLSRARRKAPHKLICCSFVEAAFRLLERRQFVDLAWPAFILRRFHPPLGSPIVQGARFSRGRQRADSSSWE